MSIFIRDFRRPPSDPTFGAFASGVDVQRLSGSAYVHSYDDPDYSTYAISLKDGSHTIISIHMDEEAATALFAALARHLAIGGRELYVGPSHQEMHERFVWALKEEPRVLRCGACGADSVREISTREFQAMGGKLCKCPCSFWMCRMCAALYRRPEPGDRNLIRVPI